MTFESSFSGFTLDSFLLQGALLNDSISGIFSGLAGTLPLTTFAQNNGIISLTAVASKVRYPPRQRSGSGACRVRAPLQ